jgi:UDP-N-acetylmuramate dehydrogenase
VSSIRELAEKFKADRNFRGTVLTAEPMSKHTTMRTGGNAALFLVPADADSLVHALSLCRSSCSEFFILGGGSNLIVSDDGFDGAVISTSGIDQICADGASSGGVTVSCGSGVPTASLVSFCTEHALSGMEQFAGLPGTAGGALFMNARCFDKSISDVLCGADYIDPESLAIVHYDFSASDWDYKKSPFQGTDRIVVKAYFCLCSAVSEDIATECKKYIGERICKGHFKYPSAGSVFKNNRAFGFPSGKIIDECGLRGYAIGGAQIAPWHGNFIINTGNAKSSEIRQLVDYTIQTVRKKTGFTLEPEVIFCGTWR